MTDDEFQSRLSSLPGPPFLEDFEMAAFDLCKAGTHEQRVVLIGMLRNIPRSDRLTREQQISRALRSALERINVGADFLEAPELRIVCDGLEYFLPLTLAEIYPYWKGESLDGFYFSEARKLGSEMAELFGVCILISDQTVTPLHVRLRVSRSGDKIDWMECKLGRRGTGEGEMERVPWPQWRNNPFIGLISPKEPIDWVYKIRFGERQ